MEPLKEAILETKAMSLLSSGESPLASTRSYKMRDAGSSCCSSYKQKENNMKYRVAKSGDLSLLESEVNECIKEEWVPHGGIAISEDESYICYYQAMIKNKGE